VSTGGAKAGVGAPVEALQQRQSLGQDDAAGGREVHRGKPPPKSLEGEWLAPYGAVALDIGDPEDAPIFFRHPLDGLGGGPRSQGRGSVLGIAGERRGEGRETQPATGLWWLATGQPDRRRLGKTLKALALAGDRQLQPSGDDKAIGSQLVGRLHHIAPGQAAKALMQGVQPGGGAGSSGRQGAFARGVVIRTALAVQVHVPSGGRRCRLPEVEAGELLSHLDHGKATAAQVAGIRLHHGQRQSGRHRRVDGVAARAQDLDSSLGCRTLTRGHGATSTLGGGERGCVGGSLESGETQGDQQQGRPAEEVRTVHGRIWGHARISSGRPPAAAPRWP
jgi:hypothetical protein